MNYLEMIGMMSGRLQDGMIPINGAERPDLAKVGQDGRHDAAIVHVTESPEVGVPGEVGLGEVVL